jgi:FHS family Na+ dependent glucose MFS transporter 1
MTASAAEGARRTTYSYFAAFVAIGMSGGLLGPALPHLAEMTGATMGQIALLFTARALGNMLGSVVSGALVDRFPGHRVVIVMLGLMALGLAAVPFSQALATLAAVVFLLGFSEVSINAGANTLLLWTHGPASPPWISALHFCFALGNMLVPLLLVAALAVTSLFHLAFWAVALYALLLIAPLARQPSPSPPAPRAGTGAHRAPDPWRLALFLLLFALYVGMEVTFAGWITTYATLAGTLPGRAALLVTLFWVTLCAGRLLAIPLLRRITPWRVLWLCLGLALLASLALHLGWLPLSAVALLFGLASSAIFPTLFGLANQLMTMSGRTTGLVFLAAGSGAMAVPSLTGPLLEWSGTGAFAPLLIGLVCLQAAGLVLLHHRIRHCAAGVPQGEPPG